MSLRKTSVVLLLWLAFQGLKATQLSSKRTASDLVDSIKNQLNSIKTEVTGGHENEKLIWQVEAFKNWYQAEEEHRKNCPTADLSRILFPEWTVIERRLDGSENFYRNWSEYQQGFGDTKKEFFFGLEPLHQLIKEKGAQQLLIILGDHDKQMVYAKYDNFVLGSAPDNYELKALGSFSGTAGDALSEQVGKKFTTRDRDNDESKLYNCAKLWRGAWWFGVCHQSHLNGPFMKDPISQRGEKGITWDLWHGMNYSLKFVLMMVRSKV